MGTNIDQSLVYHGITIKKASISSVNSLSILVRPYIFLYRGRTYRLYLCTFMGIFAKTIIEEKPIHLIRL